MSPLVRPPLTLEHALLGFLRTGPLHGYEVYRRLTQAAGLGRVWRLKQSHLYALLARLEEEGYVASRRQAQETRPPRKVFRLTRAGGRAFLDWVQRPVARGRDFRLDFLSKLYFAQREGDGVLAGLLAGQRAALCAWLAAQQAQAQSIPDQTSYDWLVCQFRIGQIQAMLDWMDQCEASLPAAPAQPRPDAPG